MLNDDSAKDVSQRSPGPGATENVESISPPEYRTPQKSVPKCPYSDSRLKKSVSHQRSTPKTPSRVRTSTPSISGNTPSSNRILEERLLQQGLMRKMTPNGGSSEEESPPPPQDELVYNYEQVPPMVGSSYKIIYMIRHGESLGQTATRAVRCTDPSLRDCALSRRGQEQARQLRQYFADDGMPKIQLVLCSPLARAIQTAGLAFGRDDTDQNDDAAVEGYSHPTQIIIHYHLRELGSNIPENQPRSMKQVKRHLIAHGGIDASVWERQIDTLSLELPPRNDWSAKKHLKSHCDDDDVHSSWPYQNQEHSPDVIRRDYVQYVLHWLAAARPETCVAVVCHYHVIRTALTAPSSPYRKGKGCNMNVKNASPIKCHLCTLTGQLTLAPS
jgi:broad specificity phosphatase PhoE